jgi:hypothetical protein
MFFFEKKNQKTFMTFGFRVWVRQPAHENQMDKSFLLLFFKKEALSFFPRDSDPDRHRLRAPPGPDRPDAAGQAGAR